MRLLIDTLIATMLAGILGGILVHHRKEQDELLMLQRVHASLSRLQEVTLYQGALRKAEETEPSAATVFPREISPEWFGGDLPTNPLAPGRQPWLDLAPPDDHSDHPPDPVLIDLTQGGFWYNPNRGVFRVRVRPRETQRQTLELYNTLNGSWLKSLSRGEIDASRRPEPLDWKAPTPQAAQTVQTAKPRKTLATQPTP